MALLAILAAVTVFLLAFLAVRQARNNRTDPLRLIPGPPAIPIIGNVFEMFQIEAIELFMKWCSQYGKVLKYKVFLIGTQVMVSDADILKHILVTNSLNYKKPESLLIPVRKIFGNRCLISLSRDEHNVRRKILSPAFNTGSIKNKVITIQATTKRLIDTWGDRDVVHIQDDLTRLSLDILGDCVFGYNFNCIAEPEQELTAALYRLMTVQDMSILRMIPFYDYLPTRLNRDLHLIRTHVKNIISNKQNSVPGENQTDMLDLMLQSRSIEGTNKLTNEDIVDDIILFLIAGHETATNVMSWLFLELARHPDIQKRCREEIKSILQDNQQLDYSSCNRLIYIENCLKEALRLYPPVPLTCRQTISDDYLGEYHIPGGTTIALQIAATMRQPDYYRLPELFDPDRYTTDQTQPHHFIPFLSGPEMCIGAKFAMLEMKLIVARIVERMDFGLVEGTETLFKGCQGLTYNIRPNLYLRGQRVL